MGNSSLRLYSKYKTNAIFAEQARYGDSTHPLDGDARRFFHNKDCKRLHSLV